MFECKQEGQGTRLPTAVLQHYALCLTDDPGGCIDFKLGSNVMRCKTEKEWRDIGHTQCALRGRVDRSLLTDMQVC